MAKNWNRCYVLSLQAVRKLLLIYIAAHRQVYTPWLSILKDGHDAQDVTQDTFIRIWDCATQYRVPSAPMAWILTIARNLALTKLRQNARLTELDDTQWNAIPSHAPSKTPEDRHLLQSGLAILAEEDRRIIMLHAATGLKHREIATLLEIPLAPVLSKYHRTLNFYGRRRPPVTNQDLEQRLANGMEYEYTIDGTSGTVLEHEQDRND